MADYASGLPVRSEVDGADERLQSKIVDFSTPSQGMEVDTDGNAHAEMHGNDLGGVDRVVAVSESGNISLNGDYDVATNTNPSSVAMVAHDRGAAIDETSQNKRVTAVAGTDNTVCMDIALRDEAGAPFTEANPLWVINSESSGVEVHNYDTQAALAAAGTDNHEYTTTAEFDFKKVYASASGKLKIEILVETAAASGVFNTRAVAFNSTANPNIDVLFTPAIVVPNGAIVRVIRTNKDNQAQDVYSTIMGNE